MHLKVYDTQCEIMYKLSYCLKEVKQQVKASALKSRNLEGGKGENIMQRGHIDQHGKIE